LIDTPFLNIFTYFLRHLPSALTTEEFVEQVSALTYVPPLGGPFCSAKDGKEIINNTISRFFDILVREGSEKLTKHRMATRMKELAGEDEGINWKKFEVIMNGN